jgi:plasmid maintenance system killer protein
MIVSFRDQQTRKFSAGKRGKAFAGFERQGEMKLDQLEAAPWAQLVTGLFCL